MLIQTHSLTRHKLRAKIYCFITVYEPKCILCLSGTFSVLLALSPPSFPLSLLPSLSTSLLPPLQIALDTFHWNPIHHVFVWGSIISWFVVIPITSSPGLYNFLDSFHYNGVAYEVMGSAAFWFYWPLATMVALMPTVIFRLLRLDLNPHLIDDVRLREKKEGKQQFRRRTIRRKSAKKEHGITAKRTGYAFAHQEGFAHLIMSGLGFGIMLDRVKEERRQRMSSWMGSAPGSRTVTPTASPGVFRKAPEEPKAVVAPGPGNKSSELGMEKGQVSVDVHTSPLTSPLEARVEVASDPPVHPKGTEVPLLPGTSHSPTPEAAVKVSMEDKSADHEYKEEK